MMRVSQVSNKDKLCHLKWAVLYSLLNRRLTGAKVCVFSQALSVFPFEIGLENGFGFANVGDL